MAEQFGFPGCTALRLTSREGRHYWFRTCDIGGDIWKDGAHIVSFPAGAEIPLIGRKIPLRFTHSVLGVTSCAADTWMLDGVNNAGLTGGLLALHEGTSVETAATGAEGVMGMELVTLFLATCGSVREVIERATEIQVLNVPHGGKQVPSTMHCMFVEPTGGCAVLEAANPQRPGRLTVYRENLGLMTNSPPYPRQLQNLSWYLAHSPELRWGLHGKPIDSITLNGLTVHANPCAPHWTQTGTFPASYAACDRFVRMAVLTWLNDEGRQFSDDKILPLGSGLMSSVMEPHSKGVYHYIHMDENGSPVRQVESYTQYLVMYDLSQRLLFLRPYDATAWSKFSLERCASACKDGHAWTWKICRDAMGGVIEEAVGNSSDSSEGGDS